MTEPISAQDLFKGRHFDQEIIVLCVRWYLAFKLSSRDLVQMMAERGIGLAHTTILRWVQRYVPEFEKRWNRYALPVGNSWRVDETYIKVRGQWVYLYRAVDKEGPTVDLLLSRRRDIAAAKRFFTRAVKQHGAPRVITLDGYAASHRAVDKLKATGRLPRRVRVRSSERVFEKLPLPLRSRAHLRDYGSHEHPMLRHRSQRRRLGLDRPVPVGSPLRRTTDPRAVLNAIFYLLRTGCQWRLLAPLCSRARAPFTITFVPGKMRASWPNCNGRFMSRRA